MKVRPPPWERCRKEAIVESLGGPGLGFQRNLNPTPETGLKIIIACVSGSYLNPKP